MRKRLPVFIAIVQSVLLLSHWFVYETWVAFRAAPDPPGISMLAVVALILAVAFPTATLLAWRYSNGFARAYYKMAAVWLGSFSFLFFAAISSWILYGFFLLFGTRWDRRWVIVALFS